MFSKYYKFSKFVDELGCRKLRFGEVAFNVRVMITEDNDLMYEIKYLIE